MTPRHVFIDSEFKICEQKFDSYQKKDVLNRIRRPIPLVGLDFIMVCVVSIAIRPNRADMISDGKFRSRQNGKVEVPMSNTHLDWNGMQYVKYENLRVRRI